MKWQPKKYCGIQTAALELTGIRVIDSYPYITHTCLPTRSTLRVWNSDEFQKLLKSSFSTRILRITLLFYLKLANCVTTWWVQWAFGFYCSTKYFKPSTENSPVWKAPLRWGFLSDNKRTNFYFSLTKQVNDVFGSFGSLSGMYNWIIHAHTCFMWLALRTKTVK